MTENINFRTAVRGYNKEDVNRFILESDRLHREAEAELQEKIQMISEERDNLRSEIKSLREELTEKTDSLAKANADINDLQAQLSSLDDHNEELKKAKNENEAKALQLENDLTSVQSRLEETNKEVEKLNENVTLLKSQNDLLSKTNQEQAAAYADLQQEYTNIKAQKESLEQELSKAKSEFSEKQAAEVDESEFGQLLIEFESLKTEYARVQTENDTLRAQVAVSSTTVVGDDAMQARLGEVILQANRTAEQIIHDANTTAKLIKMGAVEEATVIKKNFEDKMQQRAERAERLLKELSDKYFAAFEEAKESACKRVSEIIDEKKIELSVKSEAMQKETEAGLLLTDAQAAALLN